MQSGLSIMKSPPCTLAQLGLFSGTKNIDKTHLWTIQYDKRKQRKKKNYNYNSGTIKINMAAQKKVWGVSKPSTKV